MSGSGGGGGDNGDDSDKDGLVRGSEGNVVEVDSDGGGDAGGGGRGVDAV